MSSESQLWLKTLPLSLRLVRELHEKLMTGVRGQHATPGEFRRTQNWIGRPGDTLAQADYVPPPPDSLGEHLSAWEKFLHDRLRWHHFEPIYLSAYSPDLNPIERLWLRLKADWFWDFITHCAPLCV